MGPVSRHRTCLELGNVPTRRIRQLVRTRFPGPQAPAAVLGAERRCVQRPSQCTFPSASRTEGGPAALPQHKRPRQEGGVEASEPGRGQAPPGHRGLCRGHGMKGGPASLPTWLWRGTGQGEGLTPWRGRRSRSWETRTVREVAGELPRGGAKAEAVVRLQHDGWSAAGQQPVSGQLVASEWLVSGRSVPGEYFPFLHCPDFFSRLKSQFLRGSAHPALPTIISCPEQVQRWPSAGEKSLSPRGLFLTATRRGC